MARSDERANLLSRGRVLPLPVREPVSATLPTRLRSGTGQYRQETKPDAQRRGRQNRPLAAPIGGRDAHPDGAPRPSLGHVGVFRRVPRNGSSAKVGGGVRSLSQPVSGPKFPVQRENTGKSCEKRVFLTVSVRTSHYFCWFFLPNSLPWRTGNFIRLTGTCSGQTGIRLRPAGNSST